MTFYFTAVGKLVMCGNVRIDTCNSEAEAVQRAAELNRDVKADPKQKRPTNEDLKHGTE